MSQLKYSDIEGIVEELVRVKSHLYTFSNFESDDIAQEIRIICLRALDKFDSSRIEPDKWKNYFGRCIDNGLKNLRRDNYVRMACPYQEDYDALDPNDVSEQAVRIRRLYHNFQKRIKTRLGIHHAVSSHEIVEEELGLVIQNDAEYKDLEEYLIARADEFIVTPLELMLEGRTKEVTAKEKKRVREFVQDIFNQLALTIE